MDENRNPWTGEIHRQAKTPPAQIEAMLADADAAFPGWVARGLDGRADVLRRIATVLKARRRELAALATAEMGKLAAEALAEIDKCAGACTYYADHAADYLRDERVGTEAKHGSYVTYEPIGCVLAVMPWNYPFWQVFRFLAPALMAGNVAVLKHATNVPRCADAIGAVLVEAGVRAGVFGVLHIDNDATATLIADPRIKAVALTGSERAGRSVAATAGANLKKCVLELGGSDPFVVLADADLDEAVRTAVSSRFGNAGQACIAAKRFIVVEAIADEFVSRFVDAASKLTTGDPADPKTSLAPMARADLRDGIDRQVRDSVSKGARVLLGGTPGQGATTYPATILDHVAPGMPAYDEELFGPVASVLRVPDDEEAVRVANDTAFGLGASVWTTDRARGDAIARRIASGICFVNAQVRSTPQLPFGGTKTSGFGRELAEHGIREFMNIKTVYID